MQKGFFFCKQAHTICARFQHPATIAAPNCGDALPVGCGGSWCRSCHSFCCWRYCCCSVTAMRAATPSTMRRRSTCSCAQDACICPGTRSSSSAGGLGVVCQRPLARHQHMRLPGLGCSCHTPARAAHPSPRHPASRRSPARRRSALAQGEGDSVAAVAPHTSPWWAHLGSQQQLFVVAPCTSTATASQQGSGEEGVDGPAPQLVAALRDAWGIGSNSTHGVGSNTSSISSGAASSDPPSNSASDGRSSSWTGTGAGEDEQRVLQVLHSQGATVVSLLPPAAWLVLAPEAAADAVHASLGTICMVRASGQRASRGLLA